MPASAASLQDSGVPLAHPRNETGGAVRFQEFLGVGLGLLCCCLLVGCAICWLRLKRCTVNKSKAQTLGHQVVDPGPVLPSAVISVALAIQQQDTEIKGAAVLDVPPPATPDSPTLSSHKSPLKSKFHGRASLPSIPFSQKSSLPVKPILGLDRRCTIIGDSLLSSPTETVNTLQLDTMHRDLYSVGSKPRPHLHFTLSHSQLKAMLTVTVVGVSHLPKGFRASRDSYVKVYLLPKFAEPQRTALQRRSLNPTFHEQFHFGCYRVEDLQDLTLRFAVYVKEFPNLKDSFIGEVMFPCAQAAWNQGSSFVYTQELSSTKTKLKKSLSSQDVSYGSSFSRLKSVGQLFLLLQYQALANRIKVLVRKADNLGRFTRKLGTPDHYVIIHLYHDGKILNTKETKSIAGYNPVWNTPFLFSIPAGDIQEQQLALEFIVMQARLYTRNCAIGRVLIGPDTPEMGRIHWREMCSPGNVEFARWHSIQPESFQLGP